MSIGRFFYCNIIAFTSLKFRLDDVNRLQYQNHSNIYEQLVLGMSVMYNCQRPRKGKVIEFSSYVAPACLPKKSNRVTSTFRGNHCEIAGWGMQVFVSHSLKL